jgi:hypothetical protein
MNIPCLANMIALNVMHTLLSSSLYSYCIVSSYCTCAPNGHHEPKKLADSTCDGLAGGGSQCFISLPLVSVYGNTTKTRKCACECVYMHINFFFKSVSMDFMVNVNAQPLVNVKR